MKFLVVLLVLAAIAVVHADWLRQDSGTKVQFRGLSAVSNKVCWAAGAEGTFARTVDGTHWTAKQIPGLEKLTFRSVVAWDANTATLLAIGAGDLSRIYHTTDGGKSWALQFKNPDPKAFYDCIQFWDKKHGIALSDPVDGKFRILLTSNGGEHWRVAPSDGMPPALTGEGAFAASGTCLVVQETRNAWFASGGASVSRVFRSTDGGNHWRAAETPIPAGKETSGIFGLAFKNPRVGIAVGGDYKDPSNGGACAISSDGGLTWAASPASPADGLLEGAAFLPPDELVVVGPVGSGFNTKASSLYAERGAEGWGILSGIVHGLHACSFVGLDGWAAGDGGLIIKWIPKKD